MALIRVGDQACRGLTFRISFRTDLSLRARRRSCSAPRPHLHRRFGPRRSDRADESERPMIATAFRAYVEQVLAPTLNDGDVAVRIICPPTKAVLFAAPFRRSASTLCCCRPIRLISIQSKTPTPSSNRTCARPPPGLSKPSRTQSLKAQTPSHQANAPTPAMVLPERILLTASGG